MTGAASAGLFGKLPARGDFVRAGLPGDFVAAWDDWLQDVLAASRAQLGAAWLPTFLKAPVWRFLLPPGHCGAGGVLGVLLPSVDRVGRYFPLTLAAVMPPAEAAPDDAAWLDAAVAAGLAALERDAPPDEVVRLLPPAPTGAAGAPGFWTLGANGAIARRLVPAGLPEPEMFTAMLEPSEAIPC
jgi:type VI secretion system protein ImpM